MFGFVYEEGVNWSHSSCVCTLSCMGIQPLMGIHEKRAIWHPVTLCYPTVMWMWKMWLWCLMLNPPRMRLEVLILFELNVGLKMLWCLDDPSKCRSNTLCTAHVSIPLSQLFHFCVCDVGDIHDNVGYPHVAPSSCRASNSVDVQIVDDEEPYGISRAIDSDDDRPVAAPLEQDMELIRLFCPDQDLAIHEFSDLTHSHKVMQKEEMISC